MRSRRLNKRIEVWSATPTSDGFGGNTITEALLTSSWAEIKTAKPNRSDLTTDNGILDTNNSVVITLRKRNDLTYDSQIHFFKYRGEKYIINSFPVNVDFEDSFIKIICTKESN